MVYLDFKKERTNVVFITLMILSFTLLLLIEISDKFLYSKFMFELIVWIAPILYLIGSKTKVEECCTSFDLIDDNLTEKETLNIGTSFLFIVYLLLCVVISNYLIVNLVNTLFVLFILMKK